MSVQLQVDPTPNPNAMKITANETLFSDSTSVKKGESSGHALADALVQIEGVDNVFGFGNFVTVNKTADASWDPILDEVEKAFEEAELG
ncbi:scaffold Nfu/NifU family protein [Salsuginibacillus halophilus]|uniref:Scaffold Nfu/NifU family protein n=1 Tax=Salsuginibacillus halophilus TaxID=517424 RepID=A0A2P8HQM1_9BACI|nr:NifU N-terminal domain-containing protein [Salsuginibacillus halophilus]PSL48508.1 scaffold Nfu/NifU family protein [Salsuginibacillus halophilus]